MITLASSAFWICVIVSLAFVLTLTYIVSEGERRIRGLERTSYKMPIVSVGKATEIARHHMGIGAPKEFPNHQKALDTFGKSASIHKIYWMKTPRQGIQMFDEFKARDRAWTWDDEHVVWKIIPGKPKQKFQTTTLRVPPILKKIGSYGRPKETSRNPQNIISTQDVRAEVQLGNRYMFLTDELDQNWGYYLIDPSKV